MQLMSQDANLCWLNVECSNVLMFQCSNDPMFQCVFLFIGSQDFLLHWSIGQFWIGGLIWLTLFDEIFEKNPKSHSCKFYEIFYQNMISHSSRFGETLNPWWHSFGSYVTRIQFFYFSSSLNLHEDKISNKAYHRKKGYDIFSDCSGLSNFVWIHDIYWKYPFLHFVLLPFCPFIDPQFLWPAHGRTRFNARDANALLKTVISMEKFREQPEIRK